MVIDFMVSFVCTAEFVIHARMTCGGRGGRGVSAVRRTFIASLSSDMSLARTSGRVLRVLVSD